MRTINPIFIVGVPRSGTTLVRLILNSHPRLYAGSEMPWLGGNYGGESLRGLYDRMKYDGFSPLHCMTSIDSNILREIFREFIENIIEREMVALGKSRWVEKTPDNIVQVPFLNDLFPEAKYIHIVRDGRDIALSTLKTQWDHLSYFEPWRNITGDDNVYMDIMSIEKESNAWINKLRAVIPRMTKKWLKKRFPSYWNPPKVVNLNSKNIVYRFKPLEKNYYNALWRWREWISKYESDVKLFGIKSITLNYEDIVSHPEESFSRIFQFIGEEWSPEILSYQKFNHQRGKREDAGSSSCLHFQTIDASNVNKWKNELTPKQKKITSRYFDSFLVKMGYEKTLR